MAPFGKVHAAVHNAADRVKSGLAWANHRYQQGVGLAQRINDYYHTGKKVAGLMMFKRAMVRRHGLTSPFSRENTKREPSTEKENTNMQTTEAKNINAI